MSKQKKYTGKNKAQVQVASTKRRQANIIPGGTNFTPINDKIVDQMYTQMAPQSDGSPMYAPGAPIRPIPGITPPQGPRQFAYEVGYNIGQLPRGTEEYSFEDLRNLAKLSDYIQICQQVWFDYVSKLELVIEPRPELIDEDQDMSMYQPDIDRYMEFFEFPDRDHDLHAWLRMLVKDQLEIDATAIYVRKNKIGLPYSLDILDGATIKPLLDDRGRKPELPFPAYEQFVYGVPSAFLTSDDLIYTKETERTDSVYGCSRIQRVIIKINQALRKQSKDLARFTDGSIPAGVLEPSMDLNWTLEQIETYEQQFNNLIGGNDQARARIKVLPRGMTFKATDDPDIHTDFDMWVLNVIAACHGLTMDELAMTGNSNRSVGQTQENVVYRRAMSPLMNRYAQLITHILVKYFGEKRFIAKWRGFEEQEDFSMLSTAYSTLVTSGIQSPTQAARAMHLPVYNDVDIPPYVLTKTGPMFLEDLANPKMREAQQDAQMAGLQMAIQNPSDPNSTPQDDQEPDIDKTSDKEDDENDKPSETPPSDDKQDRAISAEYRRWRTVVLRDMKENRPIRQFTSDLIPKQTLSIAHMAFERCATPEQVKIIFENMRNI